MSQTFCAKRFRKAVADSLFLISDVYRRRRGGDLQYDGERPPGHWQAHGYFPRPLVVLQGAVPRRAVIWKRRWLNPETGRTCHSRPPDDLPSVRFCTLVVVVKMWAYLDATAGRSRYSEVLPALQDCGTSRTMQRWLRRASVQATESHHAILQVVKDRCEPRPLEQCCASGLSPPDRLQRRWWRDGPGIRHLWSAFAILFHAAIELKQPAAKLLAEAHRRLDTRKARFLM